jgi:hypothetical protein
MDDARTAAEAFCLAARHAEGVLRDRRIVDGWDLPSALPRMAVGTVAGHMYLVVRRVDKHLDAAATPVPPQTSGSYPLVRVGHPEDLDLEVHRQVRRDGRRVAAWGWEAVSAAYGDRLAKLESRLAGSLPGTVRLGDRAVAFPEYLASRVVELLVHADDLVASLELHGTEPPSPAVDVAVGFLVQAARRSHGDVAVLRAFTRRERVGESVPFVY